MSPRKIPVDLFRQDACLLGEGPFWQDNQIWWVDIDGGLLLSADTSGKLVQKIPFEQRIGSAVPAMDGTLVVALEQKLVRLHLDSKKWETIAAPENIPSGSRFNDGKCDPRGRLVVGTMNPDDARKDESLYSLHRDGSLHRLRSGISISNGLAWTADGKTMYFIDTVACCVFAYDYDLESGAISNEQVILRFPEKDGWPDGMSIDTQGRLWIGFWDGWAIRCYQPKTGECEAIVEVPCARPTSCCFGGENLDQLFITTARCGLTEDELPKQPLAGSLFICHPDAKGFPTSLFDQGCG